MITMSHITAATASAAIALTAMGGTETHTGQYSIEVFGLTSGTGPMLIDTEVFEQEVIPVPKFAPRAFRNGPLRTLTGVELSVTGVFDGEYSYDVPGRPSQTTTFDAGPIEHNWYFESDVLGQSNLLSIWYYVSDSGSLPSLPIAYDWTLAVDADLTFAPTADWVRSSRGDLTLPITLESTAFSLMNISAPNELGVLSFDTIVAGDWTVTYTFVEAPSLSMIPEPSLALLASSPLLLAMVGRRRKNFN